MLKLTWLNSVAVLVMVLAGAARAAEKAAQPKPPEPGAMQFEIRFDGEKAAAGQKGEEPAIILEGGTIRVNDLTLVLTPSASSAAADQYWLGMQVEPAAADLQKKLKLPAGQGLLVKLVVPESPAAKAGIQPKDVLLKVGGKNLENVRELIQAVQAAKGTDLVLELNRDGKVKKITVRPARRPAALGGVVEFPSADEGSGAKAGSAGMSQNEHRGGEGKCPQVQTAVKERIEALWNQRRVLQEKASEIQAQMNSLAENMEREKAKLADGMRELRGMGQATARKAQIAVAIGLLRQAGLPEEADRVQKKLQAIEQQAPKPQARDRSQRPDPAVAELRKQIDQMRQDIKELRQKVERMSHDTNPKR